MLFVTVTADATFVALNGRRWHVDYLDWSATRAVRARAEKVFRDETGARPPAELVHILGSGKLSHRGRVYDIGLTAEQIISCGSDKAVRCWSAETGESLQVISNVKGYVAAKSSLLVTIDNEQRASVYDTGSSPLKLQRQFSIAAASEIQKAFASPLNPILAVIYDDAPNEIQLFDLDNGSRMSTLRFTQLGFGEESVPQEARTVAIGFREDGRLLAACKDRFLLIDARSGEVATEWTNDPWPFDRQMTRDAVRLKAPWWLVVGASTTIVWNEETNDWKEVDGLYQQHFGGYQRTQGTAPSAIRAAGAGLVRE
ncbi:MAG: hypothetical protein CMJ64_04465 [Planctomycetaceae bacterium]|nr:hypothetical protein [Planctomycetaceae bacterium]